jgi:hypothetical protein
VSHASGLVLIADGLVAEFIDHGVTLVEQRVNQAAMYFRRSDRKALIQVAGRCLKRPA